MSTVALQEILALEHRVWQAVVQKNGSSLAELFADDYVEITLQGTRIKKDAVVTESPLVDDIDRYSIHEGRVLSLGEGSAVLSYHLELHGKLRGEPITPTDRWATSIWRLEGNNWRCCFFQQSVFAIENPWLHVPANEYDTHLAHPQVQQRPFLDRVLQATLLRDQPRSLAIPGCATGGGLGLVNPEFTERIVAIDINREYLQRTRERYAHSLPGLVLLNTNLETCELSSAEFDLIWCALVLEYVKPETVLPRFARWLAPGGTLQIVLQLESSAHSAVTDTGCESLKRLAPVLTLHQPETIREIATRAGLVEIESHTETLSTGKQFHVVAFQKEHAQP